MHAEIVSIGSELTTGAKLDTNCQWLSLELSAVGIPVHFHVTVADDLAANVDVLRAAVGRSDIVLVTGGLGPTLDDLTREALAALTGVRLILHEPSLQIIKGMFSRRNREMPERNVVQAMFPEGSEPIPNPRGTAPGVYLEVARAGRAPCRIAAMPGVPSEMKAMFRESVLPRIAGAESHARVIRLARVNCFGVGESAAEQMLGDLTARGRDPEVGITVHEATITLRIVAEAASVAECQAKIAGTKAAIYERIGEYIFGEEDDELEDAVVELLKQRGQTLATAESGTGGLIAHRLTDVSDADVCYRGGFVTPQHGRGGGSMGTLFLPNGNGRAPVSAEVAAEMAQDCRREFVADFGLSVTALSHREDSESAASPPLAFIALAAHDHVETRELNLAGDPAIIKSRTAKSALNLLRLVLIRNAPEARQ